MIQIEKGLDVYRIKRGAKPHFPLNEMEIGDSFYVECNRNKISCAASVYGKKVNKKFSVTKDGDGFRCWRIA